LRRNGLILGADRAVGLEAAMATEGGHFPAV
jgi:hypothetical protein